MVRELHAIHFILHFHFHSRGHRTQWLFWKGTRGNRVHIVQKCWKTHGKFQHPGVIFTPLQPVACSVQCCWACCWIYVADIYHQTKFGLNPCWGFFSPYTWNIHPKTFECLLDFLSWFFPSPTGETVGRILTLNTSYDAVLRKEMPFGG